MDKQVDRGVKITEEVFNSTLHGLGAIAGIIGLVYGLLHIHGSTGAKIGFIVYGASLILLMLMSTMYHALSFSRAKRVFQVLDHSAILVLIAGSYTPFIVYLYTGWQMLVMLILVWAIAATGVVFKAALPKLMKRIGVGVYIGFGWLALLLVPRFSHLGAQVTSLLLLGGALYTCGALLTAIKKPFIHAGWHLMVVLAAAAHYSAIICLN